jgi:hypothetical protein
MYKPLGAPNYTFYATLVFCVELIFTYLLLSETTSFKNIVITNQYVFLCRICCFIVYQTLFIVYFNNKYRLKAIIQQNITLWLCLGCIFFLKVLFSVKVIGLAPITKQNLSQPNKHSQCSIYLCED